MYMYIYIYIDVFCSNIQTFNNIVENIQPNREQPQYIKMKELICKTC